MTRARLSLVFLPALVILATFASCTWMRPKPPKYPWRSLGAGVVVRDLLVPELGPEVREGDLVALHYTLRLRNDGLIESSTERGQPIQIQVGAGTVPIGLEQGILGMRLYGQRQIVVPPELAYGAEGKPPLIPPDAELVFDVEVMEITPAPGAPGG